MTYWWEASTVGAAVLVSALIGIFIGVRIARREAGGWAEPAVSTRHLERRAVAYLEVSMGWHAYFESVRPLAFPAEGFLSDQPRDLAGVIRSRAQLAQFGTLSAQQLHDDALEAAVALINVLRLLPPTPGSGEPDLSAGRDALRAALRELATKVDQLERQMRWELQPGPAPPEHQIEAIGRAGAARRQGTPARSGTKPLR
ncbi:MAG: hypothetical protein WAL84_04485 [Candidatus Dormiibacterota bacterium]